MKNTILVITQDTYLLQTYSGFFGRIFKRFYLALLIIRLRLLIFLLKKKSRVILLMSDTFDLKDKDIEIIKYSEEISKIDLGKYREQSLTVFNKFKEQIKNFEPNNNNLDLCRTQITSYLSYYYFPYKEVINKVIKRFQTKEIWVLGKSKEEKIARFLAKKNNLDFFCFSLFDLSWLNNWLLKILFKKRTLERKEKFSNIAKQTFSFDFNNYKETCLLSADFFRHLKTLVPLYKRLREKNKKVLFILDSLETKKSLKHFYGIKKDFFLLPQILSPKIINKIYNCQQKKYQNYWVEKFKISEVPFTILLDYFEIIMVYLLPLAEIYKKAAGELFKKVKPRAVFCLNDMRLLENSLLQTAKAYQAKRILVHSGIFLSPDKTNLYDVDYFSAVGKYIKNELLKIGYPAHKIIINGDPQLDFLADRKAFNKFNKNKIYKKLALKPNKKVVLLISDKPNPLLSYQEKKKQFQKVWLACRTNKEIQLVIKPHPTENRESLLKDLDNWGIKSTLVTNNAEIELYELLAVVKVVIIAWSMTGFEAMLFGVPVVVANFTNKDYDLRIPYVKNGGALKVTNEEELKKYLYLLTQEENSFRKQQIKNGYKFCSLYYRFPLGKAAARIIKLIK